MHSKLNDSSEPHSRRGVRELEEEIFQYLKVKYEAIDINIGGESR